MPMVIAVEAIDTTSGTVGHIYLHEMSDVLHVLQFQELDHHQQHHHHQQQQQQQHHHHHHQHHHHHHSYYGNHDVYDDHDSNSNGSGNGIERHTSYVAADNDDNGDNGDNGDNDDDDDDDDDRHQSLFRSFSTNNDDNDGNDGNDDGDKNAMAELTNTNGIRQALLSYCADIDDIEILDADRDISFIIDESGSHDHGSSRTFHILNSIDFGILKEAINECQELCKVALRLETVSRDLYYAGVYSEFAKDNTSYINEELQTIFLDSKVDNDEYIFKLGVDDDFGDKVQRGFSVGSNQQKYVAYRDKYKDIFADAVSAVQDPVSFLKKAREVSIRCVYCQSDNKDKRYLLHPYVFKKFNKEAIHMCTFCVSNWLRYRTEAKEKEVLVLKGEINEELCAICSDTPSELFMCSKCPRSYCMHCLKGILTTGELEAVQSDDDWVCMCCHYGLSKNAVPEENWKVFKICKNGTTVSNKWSNNNNSNEFPLDDSAVLFSSEKTKRNALVDLVPIEDEAIEEIEANEVNEVNEAGEVDEEVQQHVKGKRRRSKKGDEDDVPVLPPANDELSVKMRRRSSKKDDEADNNVILPPVNTVLDEVDYFGQYVQFYDKQCCQIAEGGELPNCTEDVCFLCKDGGDLLECDDKKGKKKLRCKKVYHQYCLTYEVDDDQDWKCPRHFCDICGSTNLKYVCKYCPVSICTDCPEEFVQRYGLARYLEVDRPDTKEFDKTMTVIVCQSCLEMKDRCRLRNDESMSSSNHEGTKSLYSIS